MFATLVTREHSSISFPHSYMQGGSNVGAHKSHGCPLEHPYNFFTMNDKLKVPRWLEVEEIV
jgi:hypothetical protein